MSISGGCTPSTASVDPYGQFASPYIGMGNMPHMGIDPDGGLFGLSAGWSILAGAGIGFAVGSGVGLLVDKDNWWKYGVGFAAGGGVVGGLTATPTRSLGIKLPGQYNNTATNPAGKLRSPSYKGTLNKTFDLFDRLQFGNIGSDLLTVNLSHIFNMGNLFKSFNFNFNMRAPYFNIDLFGPAGRRVFNYTNAVGINSEGSSVTNNDSQSQQFNQNGLYTVNTEADLFPDLDDSGGGGGFIPSEYGKVQLNVNTRRMSQVQYRVLKARGWKGKVSRIRWWQFWQ